MVRQLVLLFIIALTLVSTVWAQDFPFRDEAASDPSFAAFRKELRQAVRQHNWDAVLKICDPHMTYTFGPPGNKPMPQAFRSFWEAQPQEKFWDKIAKVLDGGGIFANKNTFTAPYSYGCWPKDVDEFTHVAVTSKQATIFEKADPNSRQFKEIGYCLVKTADNDGQNYDRSKWQKIELPKDYQNALKIRWGFLRKSDCAHHLDYRAGFEKKNGRWKMTFFVAGD